MMTVNVNSFKEILNTYKFRISNKNKNITKYNWLTMIFHNYSNITI